MGNLHLALSALKGGDKAQVIAAGLPNIIGSAAIKTGSRVAGFDNLSGAFVSDNRTVWGDYNDIARVNPAGFMFDASKANQIYGNSNTVQMRALEYIAQLKF